jgi:hypothetical protein
MKDWKKIAAGFGFPIPEGDFERISGPLDSLEKSFRPLVDSMPQDLDPAFLYAIPQEETE